MKMMDSQHQMKVPELVPHSHDKDSNKMVSPEQGENQSLSVLAMKGEMHSAKEMADAQGEMDNNDDSSHASYLKAHPGTNLEMNPKMKKMSLTTSLPCWTHH
jgi:hypothetical protein